MSTTLRFGTERFGNGHWGFLSPGKILKHLGLLGSLLGMSNHSDRAEVRADEIQELVGQNGQAVDELVEKITMTRLAGRCPLVKEGSGDRPPCLGPRTGQDLGDPKGSPKL